ncbi:MAG: hypothetical protein H6656_20340 [Ardenticatenaceae bacterium]|nr:hypothetical protein [Ardenticatenaceae bacterium]
MNSSEIDVEREIQSITDKPPAYEGQGYPYFGLPGRDRNFEILLYSLFSVEIRDRKHTGRFDKVSLMPGVGEQARDIVLSYRGKRVGVVQCKHSINSANRENKPDVAREIIKFVLYYLQDKSLIPDLDDFTYYYAVSSDFTRPAIDLLDNFNDQILEEDSFVDWVSQVIQNCKAFREIKFDGIKDKLSVILRSITVKKLTAVDLDLKLSAYPEIVVRFFSVEKVFSFEDVQRIEQKIESLPQTIFSRIGIYYPRESEFRAISESSFIKPQLSRPFIGREHICRDIINASKTANLVAILGIAGVGKSAMMHRLASEFDSNQVYWHEFRQGLTSLNQVLLSLARFLDSDIASSSSTSLFQLVQILLLQEDIEGAIHLIVSRLNTSDYYLFFDSIHHIEDSEFLNGFFSFLKENLRQSVVFVAGRTKPNFYTVLDEARGIAKSIGLPGFSEHEIVAFFDAKGLTVDERAVQILHDRFDGLPIALELFEILASSSTSNDELHLFIEKAENQTIEYLFQEVYEQLETVERNLLTVAGIFVFPFSKEQLLSIHRTLFKGDENQAYWTRQLEKRFLLQEYAGGFYQIHEVLKSLVWEFVDEPNDLMVQVAYCLLEEKSGEMLAELEAVSLFYRAGDFDLASDVLVPLLDECLVPYYPDLGELLLDRFTEDVVSPERWIWLIGSRGILANFWRQFDEARVYYLEMLHRARELKEQTAIAIANQRLGTFYHSQDSNMAEKYYLDSLEIKKNLGDIQGQSQIYANLGALYCGYKQFDKARSTLEQGIELLENNEAPEWAKLSLYGNLGYLFTEREQWDKAQEYAAKARQIALEMSWFDDFARSTGNLGLIEFKQNNQKAARDYYLEALTIAQEHNLWHIEELALNGLFVQSIQLGNYAEAIDFGDRLVEIKEKVGDTKGLVMLYFDIGGLYFNINKPNDSVAYYEKGIDLLELITEDDQIQVFLNNVIVIGDRLGDIVPITTALKKLKNKLLTHSPNYLLAKVYGTLGSIYSGIGKGRVSLACIKQEIAILKQLGRFEDEIEAWIHLGDINSKLSYFEDALKVYGEAIRQAQINRQTHLIIKAYRNRANCFAMLDFWEQASIDYQKALEVANKAHIQPDTDLIHNVGIAFRVDEQYQEAIKLLNSALKVYREQANVKNQIQMLTELGLAHRGLLENQDALSCFFEALKLSRQNSRLSDESNILIKLGNYYLEDEPEKAKEFYEQALNAARAAGDTNLEEGSVLSLCYAHRLLGTVEQIEDEFKTVGERAGELQHYDNLAQFCTLAGELNFDEGDIETSAEMFEQAIVAVFMAWYERWSQFDGGEGEHLVKFSGLGEIISAIFKCIERTLNQQNLVQAQEFHDQLLSKLQGSDYWESIEPIVTWFLEPIRNYFDEPAHQSFRDFSLSVLSVYE